MLNGKQTEWHTEHTICSFDVDPQLTARLPALCCFMQEAAYQHAEHLGLGQALLASKNWGWVLARQRIEINQLPKWGDTIKLRTWSSGRDRLFFYRDFEITDGDGRCVLQASTAWFVIDIEKRERLSSAVYLKHDLPVGDKVFASKLGRVNGCECKEGKPITVNYGDLDMNGHVNNVRYMEWVLDSLPLKFHQTHALQSVEVNYLAEAVYGHVVSVCSKATDPLDLVHSITTNGSALFHARTRWE